MSSKLNLLLLLLVASFFASAQSPDRPHAGELLADIQKLQVLGSALYVAAHPDDENTRLIAHLANVDKVQTAYLSLTRGDGGQNLIAPDIRELLGLTRTQELLAARRIDGGTQFFSRANDFGYSKHPDETFNIWDREEVLADAVWAIRKWRPDVVVLRFDPRAPGTTHGHHTASAIIGLEAFELAGDPEAFKEQLAFVRPWQPKRVYWNAYTWRGVPEHMQQDKIIKVDVGTYLPLLGESVAEIAARSRSQHKSQGFGSSGNRGRYEEQLELLAGEDTDDDGPFAGIDMSWDRVPGGAMIGQALARIEVEYDPANPSASVRDLLRVMRMIQELPADNYWRNRKLRDVQEIIAGAMGLYARATVDQAYATPGDSISLEYEVTNRSDVNAQLMMVEVLPTEDAEPALNVLKDGEPVEGKLAFKLSDDVSLTNPYWLNDSWKLGMYSVEDQLQRGLAESYDGLHVNFAIRVGDEDQMLLIQRPVRYRYTDPVDGEQFQPFEIVPPVLVEFSEGNYLFTGTEPQEVRVKVSAARAGVTGELRLENPEGWTAEPAAYDYALDARGQETFFSFTLTPPAGQSTGEIRPVATLEGEYDDYSRKLVTIAHDHIPTQLLTLDAAAPVAKLDLKTAGERIGYLPGAGDAISEALTRIGYEVTVLDDATITTGDLSQFDAIVIGIRAYNTEDRMPNYQPFLMDYVRNGGTLVAQYNTSRGLKVDDEEIGPYPFELSRDRVTVEEAPVKILAPDHPVVNYPNRITPADFDGWVQERGLYFPNKWADEYVPILSSNDPDEPAREGGLLVAEYGEGYYVYTGYSFFRELPAGVPGAYRLFANLVGLGNETK